MLGVINALAQWIWTSVQRDALRWNQHALKGPMINMSDNPYEVPHPHPSNLGSPPPNVQLSGPATALMIVSAICIGCVALSIIGSIVMLATGMTEQLNRPGQPISRETAVIFRVAWGALLIVVNAFIFNASRKMKILEGYNQARSASIMAIVPCIGPCYILGIPFGIWALMVLNKPEVRDAFRS